MRYLTFCISTPLQSLRPEGRTSGNPNSSLCAGENTRDAKSG
jgi:hypothetical protein